MCLYSWTLFLPTPFPYFIPTMIVAASIAFVEPFPPYEWLARVGISGLRISLPLFLEILRPRLLGFTQTVFIVQWRPFVSWPKSASLSFPFFRDLLKKLSPFRWEDRPLLSPIRPHWPQYYFSRRGPSHPLSPQSVARRSSGFRVDNFSLSGLIVLMVLKALFLPSRYSWSCFPSRLTKFFLFPPHSVTRHNNRLALSSGSSEVRHFGCCHWGYGVPFCLISHGLDCFPCLPCFWFFPLRTSSSSPLQWTLCFVPSFCGSVLRRVFFLMVTCGNSVPRPPQTSLFLWVRLIFGRAKVPSRASHSRLVSPIKVFTYFFLFFRILQRGQSFRWFP